MAETEVYVDISIGGGDAGNGTIGNPYNSLRYAFAQEEILQTIQDIM